MNGLNTFTAEKGGKHTLRIKGEAMRGDNFSKNNRKYLREELIKSARTMINKPVDVNHNTGKRVGNILWCEFDETDNKLEYIANINKEPYVTLLRNKSPLIRGVSVTADYLYNECYRCNKKFESSEAWEDHMRNEEFITNFTSVPRGIVFQGLSIVEAPESPGIDTTTYEIMETKGRGLNELFETVLKEKQVSLKISAATNDEGKNEPVQAVPDTVSSYPDPELDKGLTWVAKKKTSVAFGAGGVVDIKPPESLDTVAATNDEGKNEPVQAVPDTVSLPDPELDKGESVEESPKPAGVEAPAAKVVEQLECPAGFHEEEGPDGPACVPDADAEKEPVSEVDECPEGQHKNEAGECVPDEPEVAEAEECPVGQHKNDLGDCVPDEPVTETVEENPESQQPAPQDTSHVANDPAEDLGDTVEENPVAVPVLPEVKVMEIKLPGKLKMGVSGASVDADIKEIYDLKQGYNRDLKISENVNVLVEAVAKLSRENPRVIKSLTDGYRVGFKNIAEYLNKQSKQNKLKNKKILESFGKQLSDNTYALTKITNKLSESLKVKDTRDRKALIRVEETANKRMIKIDNAYKKLHEIVDTQGSGLATSIAKNKNVVTAGYACEIGKLSEAVSGIQETLKKLESRLKTYADGNTKRVESLEGVKETFEKLLETADSNIVEANKNVKSLEERLAASEAKKLAETESLTVKVDNLEEKLKPQFKAKSTPVKLKETKEDAPFVGDPNERK